MKKKSRIPECESPIERIMCKRFESEFMRSVRWKTQHRIDRFRVDFYAARRGMVTVIENEDLADYKQYLINTSEPEMARFLSGKDPRKSKLLMGRIAEIAGVRA